MKTQITKIMMLASLIIGSTALGTGSACLVASSGEGRNGPDRSGCSIPGKIDRGLKVPKFVEAINQCQHHLAVRKIFSQILGIDDLRPDQIPYSPTNLNSGYPFSVNGKRMGLQFSVGIYKRSGLDPFERSSTFQFVSDSIFAADGGSNVPNVPNFDVPADVMSSLELASRDRAVYSGGLTVKYDTQQDSGYDRLDNLIKGEILIKSYDVAIVPFTRTGKKPEKESQIKLSKEDFQECLSNHLN